MFKPPYSNFYYQKFIHVSTVVYLGHAFFFKLYRARDLISRAHDILSGAHDLLSGAHDVLSGAHDVLSRAHDLLSGALDVLSRAHDILSRAHDILSHAHDIICKLTAYHKNGKGFNYFVCFELGFNLKKIIPALFFL